VDDPGKLYRQRRRATQAKGLETLDSKAEVEGPSESPRESPPPSLKQDQPQLPPMGEQSQPERKIELCTSDVVHRPIINLQDAGRPFKIKAATIHMVQHSPFTDIAEALERFNEYMRAEFLEWHIGLLKKRMEKMEIEREAQDLKDAEARSICEECEEYGQVQGKPRVNASSSIQELVPLCTQLKDFVDEQAKINKDVITMFEAMEKVLENLDGKLTEVGSSIREVLIMMKMLETQVEQLVGCPMGSKGRLSVQSQGPDKANATQTHSGEMKDHTKETTKITTEEPGFEISSHYMRGVVASIKTNEESQPVKTKNMTKPKNKPVPKMVRKWVPKIAMPTKSVDPK
jgi:hypothetical protein